MSDEINWVATDMDAEGDFGRIEVVPEIMLAIAERNALNTKGVVDMADVPAAQARRHSRRLRNASVLLNMNDDSISFDLYVILDATKNIIETSRNIQAAVSEGIDRMIGLPVSAVNVHVEDVSYRQESA